MKTIALVLFGIKQMEQFCSYIMAITRYSFMEWWWYLLRPKQITLSWILIFSANLLKQEWIGKHVTPLSEHIILIQRLLIFALTP